MSHVHVFRQVTVTKEKKTVMCYFCTNFTATLFHLTWPIIPGWKQLVTNGTSWFTCLIGRWFKSWVLMSGVWRGDYNFCTGICFWRSTAAFFRWSRWCHSSSLFPSCSLTRFTTTVSIPFIVIVVVNTINMLTFQDFSVIHVFRWTPSSAWSTVSYSQRELKNTTFSLFECIVHAKQTTNL